MKSNLQILIIPLLLVLAISVSAQVAINTDASVPDNSAMLDVKSTNKGMLIPRMTSAQRAAIVSPVNGLMVYQTDGASGFYYYNSSVWQRIGETDGSETKVIAGTNSTVTGIGTIANPYVVNASSTPPDGSETKVTAGTNVTVSGTGTIANPYVIDATGGGGTGHYIGELYGGGIIFWLYPTGEHGLIMSLVDISLSAMWSSSFTTTGAVSTWDGAGNSSIILGISPAAQLCDNYINSDYGTGIYTDWYLPAIDELRLIYNELYILDKNMEQVPGANILVSSILKQFYWSSTELIPGSYYGENMAFNFGFCYGYPYMNFTTMQPNKSALLCVRAVRAF
jgi:hypothetical protein